MKTCSKCGVEKPRDSEHYNIRKTSKDGYFGHCRECRKEYSNEYYVKNNERLKEYQKDYDIEYSKNNKERIKEYYENNKERYKEYRENNIERIKEREREYRKDNKEAIRLRHQRRRNRKLELPHTLTLDEYEETLIYFNHSCSYCGMSVEEHFESFNQTLHQDHIVPLSKEGGYTKENIIPSCRSCNCSKNDTDFIEWYVEQDNYNQDRYNRILDFIEGDVK